LSIIRLIIVLSSMAMQYRVMVNALDSHLIGAGFDPLASPSLMVLFGR
jgi:hypothetical protein